VTGLGQKFLAQFFVAWAGSAIFGLVKFPLKISNFLIIFLSDQKKSLWVGSKSTGI